MLVGSRAFITTYLPCQFLTNRGELAVKAPWRIVNTPDSMRRMVNCARGQEVAHDTEASGPGSDGLSFDRYAVGYSIGVRLDDGPRGWYVPVRHRQLLCDEPVDNMPESQAIQGLRDILTRAPVIIAHNAKFDIKTGRNEGIDPDSIPGEYQDTQLLSWLLDPDPPHRLKKVVWRYLRHRMREIDFGKIPPEEVPIKTMAPYACDDVVQLFPLRDKLVELLAERGQHFDKAYHELELPMVRILERMEQRGMRVDGNHLRRVDAEFKRARTKVLKRIGSILGTPWHTVKATSTQWLSRKLIDQLKWWGVRPAWERGEQGHYSTKAEIVKEWAAGLVPGTTDEGKEVAALILEFRGLNTLISTFTSSLAARADSHGRVHTNFKQMSTRTGRFSSSKPNLQNIPVRTEDGRRIREAFIAAAGYDLLVIDYSQIELRLLAHFSRDPTMIGIYMRDEDIHQNTADALGIDRRDAKPVNFGIIYGLSTMKLAKQLRVSEAVAEGFMRGYYNAYPGVALFQSAMKEFAHKHGYTDTIIGRRRYLPDLKSGSYGKRTAAERMAVNTRVQGSAADLVKIAMRNVDRRIVAEGWRRDVHMLSQVHDELIFEVKREMIEEVGQAISWEMENCVKLRVPLVAKPSSGPSWAAAK